MIHLAYLASLVISIIGLLVIDRRFTLAFWYERRRTMLTLSVAILVFVLWDFAGIALGIFYHGDSAFSLPFTVLPEFPVEEFFFLFLLCYVTLLLYRGVERWRRI